MKEKIKIIESIGFLLQLKIISLYDNENFS